MVQRGAAALGSEVPPASGPSSGRARFGRVTVNSVVQDDGVHYKGENPIRLS